MKTAAVLAILASAGLASAQVGNNPFLDRESKTPVDMNPNKLDQFFSKKPNGFCQQMQKRGIVPADGTQNKAGSCSSTVQGAIPKVEKMVSTFIIAPKSGSTIFADVNNTITIQNQNINTGFFDNPNAGYYIVPQTLDNSGAIEGHQHITVQSLTSTKAAADPRVFAFFKGLNDPANGAGQLSTVIPAGTLKLAGVTRICSITGTFSHQPVIMPVAQRGSQDDCIRVNVVLKSNNGGGNNNGNNNNGNNNNNNNNGAKIGTCNRADAILNVGVGADPNNKNELRAVVTGKAPFTGQQSALNTAIVGNFICDRLNDQCKAGKAAVDKCKGALGALPRGGAKNTFNKNNIGTFGAAIDKFNNDVIGFKTDFANQLKNQV
ncbi:hypothetical protein BJ742DRAFT_330248 [Cladochytrium replicatum]|nr:hypothetical protein BJ742DRAFT_330248 [Cladochytrium replicatum]